MDSSSSSSSSISTSSFSSSSSRSSYSSSQSSSLSSSSSSWGLATSPLYLRVCVTEHTVVVNYNSVDVLSSYLHAFTYPWVAESSYAGLGVGVDVGSSEFDDWKLSHHEDALAKCPDCIPCKESDDDGIWSDGQDDPVVFPCCLKVVLRGRRNDDDFVEDTYYLRFSGLNAGIPAYEWKGGAVISVSQPVINCWTLMRPYNTASPRMTVQMWKYPSGEYAVSVLNHHLRADGVTYTDCVWELALTDRPDPLEFDRLEIPVVDACAVENENSIAYLTAWHQDGYRYGHIVSPCTSEMSCAVPQFETGPGTPSGYSWTNARSWYCEENDDDDPALEVPCCLRVTFSGVTGFGATCSVDDSCAAAFNNVRFLLRQALDLGPGSTTHLTGVSGDGLDRFVTAWTYHQPPTYEATKQYVGPWEPGARSQNTTDTIVAYLGKVADQYVLKVRVYTKGYFYDGTFAYSNAVWFSTNLGTTPPSCRSLSVSLTYESGSMEQCDFSGATAFLETVNIDDTEVIDCEIDLDGVDQCDCENGEPPHLVVKRYSGDSGVVVDWVSDGRWEGTGGTGILHLVERVQGSGMNCEFYFQLRGVGTWAAFSWVGSCCDISGLCPVYQVGYGSGYPTLTAQC